LSPNRFLATIVVEGAAGLFKDGLTEADSEEMSLNRYSTRLRRDQGGWALMDAVWSAAVIAMAFIATFTLFETSGRSASRNAKKSQALIVAQNEINRLRNIGQRDEAVLRAMDGTTETVVYRGSSFRVSYTAIATTGIGEGQVEACSVDYNAAGENSSMPDTSAFIYMRVDVDFLGTGGAPTGVTGSSSNPGHATLDSHFAAERSTDVNTSVGMLRVYTLDHAGTPTSNVTGVTLVKDTSTINPVATNSSKGCFLFVGLAAGEYTIRVASSAQDLYMTNASGFVTRQYQMPTGVLRSTAIKLTSPVKVVPTYKYKYNGVEKDLSTSTAGVNDFVKGTGGTGNWVAMSDEIVKPPTGNPSYFLTPGGVFMPNANSGDSDKSRMYPTTNGYSGFAGPCRINDPEQVNWVSVPASMPNATWAPNSTLNPAPIFWLSTLKPTANFPSPARTKGGDGDAGPGSDRWYSWGHTLQTGQVQVALVGAYDGDVAPAGCNVGYAIGSDTAAKWKRLPGTFAANNGVLNYSGSDLPSALPSGRYDVCVRVNYRYTRQRQATQYSFPWWYYRWQGQPETVNAVGWKRVNGQVLNFKGETATTASFTGLPAYNMGGSSDGSMTDGTTQCGDPTKWN
jgi:hypothetical protein